MLFGYNECARILEETEQENRQLKEKLKDEESWRVKIAKENSSNVSECLKLIEQKKQYKSVLDEIRELINNHNRNAGKLYYKYNNRYLLSEIKEDILQILDKVGKE